MAWYGTLPDFHSGKCWIYHGEDGQGAEQLLLYPEVGVGGSQGAGNFSPCHVLGKGEKLPVFVAGRRLCSAAPPGI